MIAVVAVKRLKDISGTSGKSQFQTELELISLAVHRNMLHLIGFCATTNERLLMYPICRSVASRIKRKAAFRLEYKEKDSHWRRGAARGLLYLHEQCDPKIIHRDVKAANVLLDDCYEAIESRL